MPMTNSSAEVLNSRVDAYQSSWQRPHRAAGTSCVHLDWRADGLPAGMADRHVSGVEARIAQCNRGAAAYVKAVGAVHHHRLLLGKLAHPFADALGVAPGDAFGDVLLA